MKHRNSKWLIIASFVALVLTVAGMAAAVYASLSNRVTRWGDSLIIGPGFTGEATLDNGSRIRFAREDGSPVLDAPTWKGRGPLYVTFIWGFTVYHTPPGTLGGGNAPSR